MSFRRIQESSSHETNQYGVSAYRGRQISSHNYNYEDDQTTDQYLHAAEERHQQHAQLTVQQQRQIDSAARARQVERECLESVRTSISVVAQTDQLSQATAVKLDEQTDSLHRIRDTTEQISANLDTSQYLLNGMKSWWGSLYQMFTKPPDPTKVTSKTQSNPTRKSITNTPPERSHQLVPAQAAAPTSEFDQAMNEDLSTLTEMLGTIHGRAREMNTTINYQTTLIGEVSGNVDKNNSRISDQRRQMKRLT